jgi:hypothetical protein
VVEEVAARVQAARTTRTSRPRLEPRADYRL